MIRTHDRAGWASRQSRPYRTRALKARVPSNGCILFRVKNNRKAAIRYFEQESAEWIALAKKEQTTEAMREIGKLREILIQECLKTLELLKRKPT
jgi:hypothetical protein